MELRSQYTVGIAIISILFIAISFSGSLAAGNVFLIVSLGLMLWLIMTVQLETYQRIKEKFDAQEKAANANYHQIEALFSLFSLLKINRPLPKMRGWAISPDMANILVEEIREKKPKVIVETGSGISTIVAAYCLKEIGEGVIISLDEEEKYAEATRNNLLKHGLQDFAKVVYAPLKEVEIGNKKWLWYDTEKLENIDKIDLLVVDGPIQAGRSQKMIRYPALPILEERLSERAAVLMDDTKREEERHIAEMWSEDFKGFEVEKIDTEFGTHILRRKERKII